ncbi:MAG: hypothetical protein E7214_03905 [Clostridium sp.]|nr:hypothetical protein [Clostridium sp.]
MKDENGNPIGVLGHLTKTHVTESNDGNMLSALNKDLYDTKINDQFSNEEIISYTAPNTQTNKQNILLDSIDTSSNKEKYINSKNPEKGQVDISSITNTSNTGLMD